MAGSVSIEAILNTTQSLRLRGRLKGKECKRGVTVDHLVMINFCHKNLQLMPSRQVDRVGRETELLCMWEHSRHEGRRKSV